MWRTVPRSRHNPQFNRSRLSPALHSARLYYTHMAGLGGFRARQDSLNTGWHNASFRGFADYMQTPEFRNNLDKLIGLAKSEQIAIMCAEAVAWRCHRSLIADALLARGIEVQEIISATRTRPHTLTAWGKITGKQVTYPAEHQDENSLEAAPMTADLRSETTLNGTRKQAVSGGRSRKSIPPKSCSKATRFTLRKKSRGTY